jgi:hypothetical protein
MASPRRFGSSPGRWPANGVVWHPPFGTQWSIQNRDYSRYFQLKDMVAKPAALGKGFLTKK